MRSCHDVRRRLCTSQVQSSIGHSDYVRRDTALAALIQPLAGEYGMHNGQPQGGSAARTRNWLQIAVVA